MNVRPANNKTLKLPRNAQIWLPGYIQSRLRAGGPLSRVWVAFCDHYEPYWRNTDDEVARRRVAQWCERWPQIAARHADFVGRAPQYTFFYPEEEYRPWLLDSLAEMAAAGISDVEVHLHHDREGEQNFVHRIGSYVEILSGRHGLLRRSNGRLTFGFIHGNWALDNSQPNGWACGLNNELTLLGRLGCYADFTMPSGDSPTQARMVNAIYWASDDPAAPKSYDTGTPVTPGGSRSGDLMMIPGPLALRWRERVLPRLDTGEIAWQDPPSEYRVRRWIDVAPRIGRDVFLKLYSHGCQEKNANVLLEGGALDALFTLLAAECRRRGCALAYVTAWEMYQAIEAARQAEPAQP